MNSFLSLVADKNEADKFVHQYTSIYSNLWDSRRLEVKKVLEIGVFNGASIRTWAEFFPNAEIFGIDLNPSCGDRLVDLGSRFSFFCGAQQDRRFLKEVVEKVGNLDIVIDDGSHVFEHQLASMEVLFPSVVEGGFYVVEDIFLSLDPWVNFLYHLSSFMVMQSTFIDKSQVDWGRHGEIGKVIERRLKGFSVYGGLAIFEVFGGRLSFDEQFYLETYPDVAVAVKNGMFSSGRDHYYHHGWEERRKKRLKAE